MRSDHSVLSVLDAVDMALNEHPETLVNVVKNEETGMLDVMYCSSNNSFPIECAVADPGNWSRTDYARLIDGLDFRHVGYCF